MDKRPIIVAEYEVNGKGETLSVIFIDLAGRYNIYRRVFINGNGDEIHFDACMN